MIRIPLDEHRKEREEVYTRLGRALTPFADQQGHTLGRLASRQQQEPAVVPRAIRLRAQLSQDAQVYAAS